MREETKKAEEEAARASGVTVTTSASEAKARAGRNAQIGGMGLLYALGADGYLFQKVCLFVLRCRFASALFVYCETTCY